MKEHISSHIKDKIIKLDKISFKILKILLILVGIFTVVVLGINNLGYSFNTISCTKSMYPYLDCPCLIIDEDYNSYYKNYNNETYLNETMNEILFDMNLTQVNITKYYEALKVYDKQNMINNYIKENIKINDIIVFQTPNGYGRGYVRHRVIDKCYETDVVEINETWTKINTTVQKGFITKGDSNLYDDGCILFDKIEKKMAWKSC